MQKYKEVCSLSPIDAAYIAGLVDGEGTITLSRKHATEERQIVVSISNTERALLEFVLQTVGAGKITRKKTAKAHHSPGLTYAIWNRQALCLLVQIAEFLRSYKRLRARLVLDNYVRLTPRNGKYTSAIRAERRLFEQALLELRARSVNAAPSHLGFTATSLSAHADREPRCCTDGAVTASSSSASASASSDPLSF